MVDAGQSGKPGRASGEDQPARSTYRPLRLILIGLILLVASSVGFRFKSLANPGTEPPDFRSQPPQYINVYETSPLNAFVPITVSVILGQGWLNPNYGRYGPVELRAQGFSGFHEEVDITVTSTGPVAPDAIIITSSIRPTGVGVPGQVLSARALSVAQLKSTKDPLAKADRFAVSVPLSGSGDTWSGAVFFNSVPIIYQDNGSTFGHLPSAGFYTYLYPPTSVLEGGYDKRTGKLKNIALWSPSTSSAIPPGERVASYGPSNYASFTERIEHILPAFSNRQMAYMSPPSDGGNHADYVWHSTGIDGLEPVFKAVDLNAADSQNQDAFYAGLAFGVAGAALIALVQEIPEERKRKSISGAQNRRGDT